MPNLDHFPLASQRASYDTPTNPALAKRFCCICGESDEFMDQLGFSYIPITVNSMLCNICEVMYCNPAPEACA